jgi:hypothetical protein
LILYVVGREGRYLIPKHKRLKGYSAEDYDLLLALLRPVGQALVTPNTLTETSNLLQQHKEPERSLLFRRLRSIIQESNEVVVVSAKASSNPAFERLGLTDAALLEAVTTETPLITVDIELHLAAIAKGGQVSTNFAHMRSL